MQTCQVMINALTLRMRDRTSESTLSRFLMLCTDIIASGDHTPDNVVLDFSTSIGSRLPVDLQRHQAAYRACIQLQECLVSLDVTSVAVVAPHDSCYHPETLRSMLGRSFLALQGNGVLSVRCPIGESY